MRRPKPAPERPNADNQTAVRRDPTRSNIHRFRFGVVALVLVAVGATAWFVLARRTRHLQTGGTPATTGTAPARAREVMGGTQ